MRKRASYSTLVRLPLTVNFHHRPPLILYWQSQNHHYAFILPQSIVMARWRQLLRRSGHDHPRPQLTVTFPGCQQPSFTHSVCQSRTGRGLHKYTGKKDLWAVTSPLPIHWKVARTSIFRTESVVPSVGELHTVRNSVAGAVC